MSDAERLIDLIQCVMHNVEQEEVSIEGLSPEYRDLGEEICNCLTQVQELCRFVGQMADGQLACTVPKRHNFLAGTSKDLFYKLKHLAWQAEEIAKGDYSQRVDFLGGFSVAFNTMIQELENRETQIKQHAEEKIREMEQRNVILRRQMERQISHYHSYREYISSFYEFREHYKKMMGEVYDLFNQGRYEEGRLLVAKINDEMGTNVVAHKLYSNNEIVNAVLTDIASVCRDRAIAVDFMVYVPKYLAIAPSVATELITIVSEYVLDMLDAEDEIESLCINSSERGGWLSVLVSCAFKVETREPVLVCAQQEEKVKSSIWAEQISQLAEKNNMLFDIKAMPDQNAVCTIIHLCMNE